MEILKVKINGVWQTVPAIKGDPGPKGDPGTNGTTPVKGVDYYTESDKQEMVQLVLAAIPSAEEVNY